MKRIKRMPRRARELATFVVAFARSPLTIGALFPSSRDLARALSGDLSELSSGDVIVEFGPGTGAITRAIADTLPPGVHYVGIERDPKFHAILCRRFPGLDFELGEAQDIAAILEARGLSHAHRIISGLPFAFMPVAAQEQIIEGITSSLKKGGTFRTFQYLHGYGMETSRSFRAEMEQRFEQFTREGPVYKNIPPAWILVYSDRP